MKITITQHSQAEPVEVIDLDRERMEDEAQQQICACYHYELANTLPDMDKDQLQEVINDPYIGHRENGETWRDCPEWTEDRMEQYTSMQIDEWEQEKYLE